MNTILHNTTRHFIVAAAIARLQLSAFDPGQPGWKMSADGKTIEMKDGNPIWIDSTGKEGTLGADAISRMNGEAKTNRERITTLEGQLAPFKDIDPVVAKKAIADIAKLGAKALIDAGEVDKVRDEITKQFTAQIAEKDKAIGTLSGDLDSLRINNVFAQSDFIRDSIAVPRDFFEASMRQNFKIKDGKIEAFDKSGNRIMSSKNIGQYAEPEEALQILVNQHPQKDTILKAPGHSGGGNNGSGGNRAGVRTVLRADFEKLPPNQQAAVAAEMGKGTVTIV